MPLLYLTAKQCHQLITPDDVLAEISRVVSQDAAGKVRCFGLSEAGPRTLRRAHALPTGLQPTPDA